MATLPTGKSVPFIRLPDAPPAEDMNNHLYLNFPGNTHFLSEHLGNKDTTIIVGDTYVSQEPTSSMAGLFEPDLMIAFNVRPDLMVERNGYVISEQGKPPDFVLEIGSASTGRRDTTVKRGGYAALGIPEYWRFDPSGGRFHGVPLAGDRLENGEYVPIPLVRLDENTWQGYSSALDLYLRWDNGQLGWYDPATGQHILRFQDVQEELVEERRARQAAEARLRELESGENTGSGL